MFELTTADIIWNRACLQDVAGLEVGDRALAAMILAHGLVMNGGVLHAVEALDADQLAAAKEGFRYFGLARVEAFLAEATSAAINAAPSGSDSLPLRAATTTLAPAAMRRCAIAAPMPREPPVTSARRPTSSFE